MDAKGGVPVVLFALLKMDDVTDRWTIIYADDTATLTEEHRKEIFDNLLAKSKEILTPEELSSIARIAIFTKNDHLVSSLLRYQSGAKIQTEKVNGNFVHEGYIIKASASSELSEKAESSTNTAQETSVIKGT